MSEIFQTVLCRDSQINELLNLLVEDEPLPYSIFLSGNRATGKTICVDKVLAYLKFRNVIINCVECYTPRIMYNLILDGLSQDEERSKCESMKDFLETLKTLENDLEGYEPVIVVLDKAERLINMDQNLMFVFARLKEYCSLNICTIFLTHLTYEKFFFKNGLREPIKIYFPNYDREELYQIICSRHKSFVNYVLSRYESAKVCTHLQQIDFFGNFLNTFLSVFYRPCRDLIELMNMTRLNFVKYCEPVIFGEIKSDELSKLWRHISPILKSNLESLYLHTYSLESRKSENFEGINNNLKEQLTSTSSFAQSFELPYYAKYLLIAAYLASYNPPKEDKRLFMKNHGKKRKTMHQVKAKAKISEKLSTQIGPKFFTLDRLLAIFYAICEEKTSLTHFIFSQIVSLEKLRLIMSSHDRVDLDNAKYKCVVGYDFVSGIAQTVNFKLRKYLYDFI